jgi:hypothetical protein
MIAVLVAVWAENDEIFDVIRSSFGLFDDVVNLEAFFRADRASMACVDQEFVSSGF